MATFAVLEPAKEVVVVVEREGEAARHGAIKGKVEALAEAAAHHYPGNKTFSRYRYLATSTFLPHCNRAHRCHVREARRRKNLAR